MYDAILRLLEASANIENPQITNLHVYGQNAFRVKIRAIISPNLAFQVWINHNTRHTRYSYQLLRQSEALFRWDNAPHHPEIKSNYPHHYHDERGDISPTRLQGTPLEDLLIVLKDIEKYTSS